MNITFIIHKYGIPIDDPCCYPLGAMYVSSTLKSLGHDVKVLNYNLFDYDLLKELPGSDLVCFTGFEEFLPLIKRDSALCKSLGIRTLVGGALATFMPRLMADICDSVVCGEAEGALEYAVKEDAVYFGKELPIDEIPLPDYEGFWITEYHRRHQVNYMGVLTSRGCPCSCTFCSQTCKYRTRSIESVFSEIDTYQEKYGTKYIVFNDNTFNISRRRATAICQGMKDRGMRWSAALRLDKVDDRFCETMAESGCNGLIVGVESFNQKYLDQMRKGLKANQIVNGLDLLHKHNLPYYGNILLGLDGQTSKDIENELSCINGKYNIFPAMVRQFVGTKEGKKSFLTSEEWHYWDGKFKAYIESKGKYCYPDLEIKC